MHATPTDVNLVGDVIRQQPQRIETGRFALEIRCDGQTVRYEGPTAEDVMRLMDLANQDPPPPLDGKP